MGAPLDGSAGSYALAHGFGQRGIDLYALGLAAAQGDALPHHGIDDRCARGGGVTAHYALAHYKSQFFQVALEGVAAFYMADVGSLACLYIG